MDQGRGRGRGRSENRDRDRGPDPDRNGGRSQDRTHSREVLRWAVSAVVLAGLAIPWFLWGTDTVVAGLPIWLWWHVGWMVLAGVGFWVFATRAWGVGIETGGAASETGESATTAGETTVDTGGKSR